MFTEIVRYLKSVYGTPSAEVIALRELEEAQRRLLEAQSGKEYAESIVKYREAQIKRLTAYLRDAHEAAPVYLGEIGK
jgi:hypothetical protein